MAAPKQTDPQFKLRLTPELKARIEEAADANGRSMNAEMLARLEASFSTHEKFIDNERRLLALVKELVASQRTIDKQADKLAHLAERIALERDEERRLRLEAEQRLTMKK